MSDPVSVELIEVICVSFDRGSVAEDDVRPVNQYWSKDGRLLAEFDHSFSAPDAAACRGRRIWPELAATDATHPEPTTEQEAA